MLKLIETGAFFEGEPTVSIIDPASVRGLVKKAADSKIIDFASKISSSPDKVYVHILAMGASEYYSSNRNGDWFPEANLLKYYETFATSPAHFFRHHQNKDPNIASGRVVHAVWNDRMKRIELIVELWREKAQDIIDKLERGEYPSTSMACRTPADTCSICGNVAKTRQEYCSHLRDELGQVYPDGRKVYAINDHPLKFFDISYVIRPADVTSSILQKVASAQPHVIGSAELAELEGLMDHEKASSHKKLSEFIKDITGDLVDSSASLDKLLAKVQDPEDAAAEKLSKFELGQIFSTMAHLGISPSLHFLADLIGYKIAGPAARGIGRLVEGYIAEHGLSGLALLDQAHGCEGPHPEIIDILSGSVKQASLFPQYVTERSMQQQSPFVADRNTVYVPGTNVGYVGNGPHIEPTARELYQGLSNHPESNDPGGFTSMIKTLTLIGSAALAAKWYITQLIKEHAEKQTNNQQPIKIVLVKSANDRKLASHLADFSMLKAIGKV